MNRHREPANGTVAWNVILAGKSDVVGRKNTSDSVWWRCKEGTFSEWGLGTLDIYIGFNAANRKKTLEDQPRSYLQFYHCLVK